MADFLTYTRRYDPIQYTVIAGTVFGFVLIAGFIMTIMQAAVVSVLTASLIVGHEQLLGWAVSPTSTSGYLIHNASVVIGSWIMGFSIVGPFVVLFENAMNIGTYLANAVMLMTAGDPRGLWLLAFIIPHGIIEIPAILLAGGVGIYLAQVMYGRVFRNYTVDVLEALRRTIPYIILALGMLVFAAAIEATLSPKFADALVKAVYGS